MTFLTVDPKDPDDIDYFGIDWGPYLGGVGETISTSQWIAPSGITLVSDSFSGTVCTAKLSGGTAGESYGVVNRITTATRTKDRTITVVVAEN